MAQFTALAIAAHPDDIEFMMAGTLLRLKQRRRRDPHVEPGQRLVRHGGPRQGRDHPAALGGGAGFRARWPAPSCTRPWSTTWPSSTSRGLAGPRGGGHAPGAARHPAGAVPAGLHGGPHQRLPAGRHRRLRARHAQLRRRPAGRPWDGDVALYHALPHGLRDGAAAPRRPRPIRRHRRGAGDAKRAMLSQHRTQKDWLDVSQGMGSYLQEMENMARQVGRMSGRFEVRRGLAAAFSSWLRRAGCRPARQALGPACWVDPDYELGLG